jgi:hypothetical protein
MELNRVVRLPANSDESHARLDDSVTNVEDSGPHVPWPTALGSARGGPRQITSRGVNGMTPIAIPWIA